MSHLLYLSIEVKLEILILLSPVITRFSKVNVLIHPLLEHQSGVVGFHFNLFEARVVLALSA